MKYINTHSAKNEEFWGVEGDGTAMLLKGYLFLRNGLRSL
jgi:hypothetical protein